ncbi:MAG: insulinase family protein, partial [Dysgonamonadaceae bacterium]|nr:insulinase family protein [Dysgonamonadaceae bacterium]
MAIKRNVAPLSYPVSHIPIPVPEMYSLPNGVPVNYLNMGEQDVCRVDLMIGAGKWQQPQALVSSFTNQLLKEGAGKLTGQQIAEQLDFYGAWLQLSDSYHYSYLTLYTLNKYFRETIAILRMMVYEPHFATKEFQTLRERRKQQFLIDNDKVQTLASKNFSKALFGAAHPYGRKADLGDFDNIRTDHIKHFHQTYYRPDNIRIILSGKITDAQLKITEEYFGTSSTFDHLPQPEVKGEENLPASSRRICIPKDKAIQNGIRMGLLTINKSHEDFPGLRVVNTLLGGYFGSRLMSNIREEKGYTYGISSAVTTYKHAAFLSIATQTAPEHTEKLIAEVYREIDRLQNETPGKQELELVRNYMLGDFSRSLDGVFSLIDAYISLLASDMNVNFLHKQIEKVKNITMEEIRALSVRYLKKDSIIEVISG